MISYTKIDEVTEKYTIDLNLLYENESDYKKFIKRWRSFYKSDSNNPYVFSLNGKILTYLSETIIPKKVDNRPFLLLLFGNPAPHSIRQRMFFSYEGSNKEHRFWKVFRNVGLLVFNTDNNLANLMDLNQVRRDKIINLDYESPFRIGFTSFYTLPSTTSSYPWSGVAGVQRLLGAQANALIVKYEIERIRGIVSQNMKSSDVVLSFQKDAYNAFKVPDSKPYSLKEVLNKELESSLFFNKNIKLLGAPPTRLLYSQQTNRLLNNIIKEYKNNIS